MTYIVYYNIGGNYRHEVFTEEDFNAVFASGKFDCNEAWMIV